MLPPVDESDWRAFLRQQAASLRELRSDLLRRVHIGQVRNVLEVACGTGEVTRDLCRRSPGKLVAVDASPRMARVTADTGLKADVLCARGESLPIADRSFDLVVFAFALLWAVDPQRFVEESVRVVRPGGVVLALGEPDYRGYVEEPQILGTALAEGLRRDGADPAIGGRLMGMMEAVGLRCEGGVAAVRLDRDCRAESDDVLAVLIPSVSRIVGEGRAREMASRIRQTRRRGERIAFVPVFWTIGRRGQ